MTKDIVLLRTECQILALTAATFLSASEIAGQLKIPQYKAERILRSLEERGLLQPGLRAV